MPLAVTRHSKAITMRLFRDESFAYLFIITLRVRNKRPTEKRPAGTSVEFLRVFFAGNCREFRKLIFTRARAFYSGSESNTFHIDKGSR